MSLLDRPALLLIPWFLLWSLILFFRMGRDKKRAIRHQRRIPEAELFLLAFLGGALGGWLGMLVFRHKTKHLHFFLGFPLLALLQWAATGYLLLQGTIL